MSRFDDDEAVTGVPDAPGAAIELSDEPLSEEVEKNIPKLGDVIPAGTYHFRVDSFEGQVFKDETKPDDPGELVINIVWKCQQEPHTGRICFDNVPYVDGATIKAANGGDPNAQALVNKRLPKAKEIMKAAGWKGGFLSFLQTNPELKLSIEVGAKRKRDPKAKGGWSDSGEQKNKITKYLSLHRSA